VANRIHGHVDRRTFVRCLPTMYEDDKITFDCEINYRHVLACHNTCIVALHVSKQSINADLLMKTITVG
jgi:hypothetical protein